MSVERDFTSTVFEVYSPLHRGSYLVFSDISAKAFEASPCTINCAGFAEARALDYKEITFKILASSKFVCILVRDFHQGSKTACTRQQFYGK